MLNSQCNATAALQPLTPSHFHWDTVSKPACADLKKKARWELLLWICLFQSIISCFFSTDWSISHFVFCFIFYFFLLLALFGDVLYHNMKLILQRTVFVSSSNHSSRKQKNKTSKQTTTFNSLLSTSPCSESIRSLLAGVDLTDSSSAAGADDFDPITRNPTSQQVTVAMVTVPGAPGVRVLRGGDVTGDHVTRADSPYIVTLKASDKRAGAVQAGKQVRGRKQGRGKLSVSRWTGGRWV